MRGGAGNSWDPSGSSFFFLKRGWTPEGPQEDSDEEALPAPASGSSVPCSCLLEDGSLVEQNFRIFCLLQPLDFSLILNHITS